MTETTPLVVIIDDEEAMRDACSQTLLKDRYRVRPLDGATGIQLIRALHPAVVIVDLKMPGMSGFEVLESLPGIDPHIVAVVITGYATVDSAVEAMKKGAHDFLPKPFTPEALRIIIARGLERRRLVLEAAALRKESSSSKSISSRWFPTSSAARSSRSNSILRSCSPGSPARPTTG
jgi:DNA-binding NtrC family response regulator